ncbi:DUF943 family protein [Yersinia sp. 2538 StPb PI]|uniref:DUF943 family protein n=1 Tax=Yersinia sp. 2538 StPb PI TaxID=3117405 RepID=UPI003FA4A498
MIGKKGRIILAAVVIFFVYIVFYVFQPVKIIDGHIRSSGFSVLIVKNPPLTDKGKISWWKKNELFIKETYSIPKPDSDGTFTVVVLDVGDGYKIDSGTDEDSDLLCFDDMKTEKNCIEKNWVMDIEYLKNGSTRFNINKSSYIQLSDGENIKKLENK